MPARPFARRTVVPAGRMPLVLALAGGLALEAQVAAPVADNGLVRETWTVSDGLPVNAVTQLRQGRDGYLWIATFNGLVRYDGARFTVFDPANTPGLPSARLARLVEGPDGTLWLGTEQGHLVRFRGGRALDIAVPTGPIAGVREIVIGSDGVWVAAERGLGRVRGETLELVAAATITAPVRAVAGLPGGGVIAADIDGGVAHVGTDGRVRRRFVVRTSAPAGERFLPFTVRVDDDGSLLVGGNFGLVRGRLDRDTLEAVPLPRAGGEGLHIVGISRPAPDGTRWLHAHLGVLRLRGATAELVVRGREANPHRRFVDDESGTWFTVDHVLYRDGRAVHTLPLDSDDLRHAARIATMTVDREGSIWLGSEARGLHRLSPAVFRSYGSADGLGGENFYSIVEDERGMLWTDVWLRGLARLDPATGRGTFHNSSSGLPPFAHSILVDAPGRLLVGTHRGLYACDVATSVRCRPDGPPGTEASEFVAVLRDEAGVTWASATSALYRRERSGWVRVPWTPNAPVRALVTTPDGARWFATNGAGLLRVEGDRTVTVTRADGLPIDVLRSLHLDDTGMLWVGTEGRGLARLDPRAWRASPPAGADRRIVRLGVDHGLPDETIHRILADDARRLWLSTNRGIMRVALHELQAVADGRSTRVIGVTYTERDGLRNREANGGYWPAGTRTRDGRLWFPTQGGLAVVDPRRLERGAVSPTPRIESLTTRTRTLLAEDTTTLALTDDERDLEFRFTAPHFLEPAGLRFRYRLDPYDADWVDAGTRRVAYYTRVPAGRYTFRVAVADARGRWTVATTPVTLAIATRWSESGLVPLLALASLVCLVAAAFRWRDGTLSRRAAELARLVDARTAALTASERELAARNAQLAEQAAALTEFSQARTRLFTYLSHEFRTPLTLILGPLQGMLEGRYGALPAEAQAQGTLMQRNAQRLLRLVNQILDLARLQTGGVVLDRRRVDLVSFVRGIVAAFDPLAEQRGIALAFESDRATLRVGVDAEQMETVLLNLIGNALKFTPAAGRVVVRVDDDGFTARIVVEDTGIGIPPADLPHVFERFYRVADRRARRGEGTGIGLALVREVVELHGGHVSVESDLGTGSRFIVGLPLEAAARRARANEAEPVTDPTRLATGVVLHASGEFVAQVPPLLTDPCTGDALLDEAAVAEPADDTDGDRTTILVVDDNADVRAWVRSILASTYRVLEAPDGARALALARVALPDLIVADVMMPELDGLGLTRALRDDEATDAIGIVLLTARAAGAAQVEGYEAGADAYLVKPFEPSVLEACVAGLLAQRRRLRDRFRADPRALAAAVARDEPTVTRETRIGGEADGGGDGETDGDAWAAPGDAGEGGREDGEATMSPLHAQLRAIVLERLTDPDLSPETLAAAAGRSYHQLYRALQAEFGWSPSRFIRSVRVEYAAELLRQGKGSVTEVAYAVGFESLSYFGRAFRERFGANPGSFAAKGVSVAPGARGH